MTRYRRSPEALSAAVGEDIVALQAVRGFAFGMEQVSASVWRLLEQGRTEAQIVAALLEEYEVEEAQCRREVGQLLAELEAEGLIEKADA